MTAGGVNRARPGRNGASPRAALIVTDQGSVAHDVEHMLAELGYAAVVAASAEEALARARDRRPDVVLVDLRIKGRVDGMRTARMLEQGYGAPIVYLTDAANRARIQRAMPTSPSGCLVTPIKPAELRIALQLAVDSRPPGGAERATPAEAATAAAPPTPVAPSPGAGDVRRQLEQVLRSEDFDASRRSRDFLRFVVEEVLAGRGEDLTQSAIAIQVFGRRADFDAVVDPIVRIQAGRVRRSLERYYLLSGQRDPVRIELPKGGYAPAFHAAAAPDKAQGLQPAPAPPRTPEGGWPALFMGEFAAVAPGGGMDELAARVSEELALELGRYQTARLFRHRGDDGVQYPARFALSGRVRQQGEDVRISARLVDCTTGEQVWGDEYGTAPEGGRWIASPEDAARVIAARVGAEEGVLVQLLASERRKRAPDAPTPYDAVLRSYEFFLTRDPGTLEPAVQALRQAVAAQPDFGLAWTRLGRLFAANHTFEVTTLETPLDQAIACAQHGVRLDPASRSARCVLASALLSKGEMAAGRAELEEAFRSSPGSLVYLEIIGYLLTLFGDWDRGALLCRSAQMRNPHCLQHVQFGLWAYHLQRGERELAYQAALENRDPPFFWRFVMRASCLGLLGRTAEAKLEVAELLALKQDFASRGRVLIGYYIKFPQVMDRIVDGLHRAGLDLA